MLYFAFVLILLKLVKVLDKESKCYRECILFKMFILKYITHFALEKLENIGLC